MELDITALAADPVNGLWRVLLVIVIGLGVVVMRSRRPVAAAKPVDSALSEEEQRRLAELLKEEEKQ